MLKPGDLAPAFDLPCAFEGKIGHLALASVRSEMVVLFFYPRDFSFICPTEVLGFHKAQAAFKTEHTSLIGASVDDAETHLRWAAELGGLSYPLLADIEAKVTRDYGVYDADEKVAMRATYVLDAGRKVAYAGPFIAMHLLPWLFSGARNSALKSDDGSGEILVEEIT